MVLGFPANASGRGPGGRVSPWPVLLVIAALCALGGSGHASERSEAELKADYLYRLTAFVAWPDRAFESPTSPFRLCLAGKDPFGGLVDHLGQGAKVGDHPVVVVRSAGAPKSGACHLLFMAPSSVDTPAQMLEAVAGRPVLTVAEETLDAAGAMVRFVTVEGRLRFEVRNEIAQGAGLAVSSKLLSVTAPPREAGR